VQPYTQTLYFEDLTPGATLETHARTITEADIVAFAALSGDYNPLHTDAVYAAQTPFGERIAHGLLVLSIASGLANRLGFLEGSVEAFTGLDWKYRAPVKIGDTVRVRIAVQKKRAVTQSGGGFVTCTVQILNQHDAIVQKGTWTILVQGRPVSDPAE